MKVPYNTSDFRKERAEAWEAHIKRAKMILTTRGERALRNPHAETGRICRCQDYFCCAAFTVFTEHQRKYYEPSH